MGLPWAFAIYGLSVVPPRIAWFSDDRRPIGAPMSPRRVSFELRLTVFCLMPLSGAYAL